MKREYDFSPGERGKFYRPGARMNLPIYLDEEVLKYLQERATATGTNVSDLANELLERAIALIEAAKG